MIRMITSFFYVGLIPVAPGTFGSLAAIPAAFALHAVGGFPLLLAGCALAFGVGWWATALFTAASGNPDPSEVVIDEVVGQWIALMPLSAGLWFAGAEAGVFWRAWPGWVGAFLMFRLFDIWKPLVVGWADRLHTPLGVMLDDVFAGVMAALLVALAAWIAHGMMGA